MSEEKEDEQTKMMGRVTVVCVSAGRVQRTANRACWIQNMAEQKQKSMAEKFQGKNRGKKEGKRKERQTERKKDEEEKQGHHHQKAWGLVSLETLQNTRKSKKNRFMAVGDKSQAAFATEQRSK